jgi:hypothetical protein
VSRRPTFIARELILFREGKCTNSGDGPMVQEYSHLTLRDIIAAMAYGAARKP